MFQKALPVFLASVFLLTPGSSYAVPLYDNLGEPFLGGDTTSATVWNANKFVTDGVVHALSSVTVRVSSTNTTSPLEVLLYSDSSNNPGASLTSLGTTSAIGGSPTDITFFPVGVNLSASTAYWIVLRSSGSGSYLWHIPTTQNGTGVAFDTAFSRSNNSGSSWAIGSSIAPPYYMSLNADVPEPATILLSGLGLAILLARRRL